MKKAIAIPEPSRKIVEGSGVVSTDAAAFESTVHSREYSVP